MSKKSPAIVYEFEACRSFQNRKTVQGTQTQTLERYLQFWDL